MIGYGYIYGGRYVSSAGVQYLVDTYSPTAAYSLRKLSSSATNAIRVRRSSDSAEQDIGFSGNDLNTSSLSTFCSGTDGFVVTWYDQSGNGYDVTQATAANQPKIVTSGTIFTTNGLTAIDYNGASTKLAYSGNIFSDGSFSLWAALQNYTNTTTDAIFDCSTTSSFTSTAGGFRFDYSTTDLRIGTRTSGSASFFTYGDTDTTQTLVGAIKNATDRYLRKDGSQVNTGASVGDNIFTSVTGHAIGNDVNVNAPMDGNFQEVLIFNTDETANISAIESDINGYYSIY